MKTEESSIKKMCSFYASKWHLTTMILPYIAKAIEENTQVETILEQGIEENIKELISRLNINTDTKQKILNINWSKTKDIKRKNREEKYQRIILINGTKERIEEVNHILEEKLDLKEKIKTTIINCYDTSEIENDIQKILKQYETVINTSGEHKIEEMFCL